MTSSFFKLHVRPFLKRCVHHPFTQKMFARVIMGYMRLAYKTSRFHFDGKEILDRLNTKHAPLIITFWHGRMAMLPFAWQWQRPFSMLLSKHRDGQLISTMLNFMGISSIFGSSSKGGARAGVQVVQSLRKGVVIGITPDGPRGPRQQCSKGVIQLARAAATYDTDPQLKKEGEAFCVYVVPVSYGVTRHKILNSWDRFMIPLPFSRGIFKVGAPIVVHSSSQEGSPVCVADQNDMHSSAGSDNIEALRDALEQEMNRIQDWVDAKIK